MQRLYESWVSVFISKVLLEHTVLVPLQTVCSSCHTAVAETGVCDRPCKAHDSWDIYRLPLYRKHLPTPGLCHSSYARVAPILTLRSLRMISNPFVDCPSFCTWWLGCPGGTLTSVARHSVPLSSSLRGDFSSFYPKPRPLSFLVGTRSGCWFPF